MSDFFNSITIFVAVVFLVSSFDEIYISLYALFFKVKPKCLNEKELIDIEEKKEKSIAILVAAWREDEVIYAFISHNINKLKYQNYIYYIGVYPNDLATLSEVEKLEKKFPSNVRKIINNIPGPTTKGQMLSVMISFLTENKIYFDAIELQDAEDMLHPRLLKIVNHALDDFDFIQTPVLSSPRSRQTAIGKTYLDEFGETHSCHQLVRCIISGQVPSAGVGTAISKKSLDIYVKNRGSVFSQESLTEDYELGLNCSFLGIKSIFYNTYYFENKKRNYIATYECFPQKFYASVKQKTRWTYGISIQGYASQGWRKKIRQDFFLYRDRKNIFFNIFSPIGYFLFFCEIFLYKENLLPSWVLKIIVLNFTLLFLRLLHRSFILKDIYGSKEAFFSIFRMPLAGIINGASSVRAVFQFVLTKFLNQKIVWSKTTHHIPEEIEAN